MAALEWDLFCRVIDNHGDVGVCWRLAADLGARGVAVRLWTDDPSALAWMAPRGAAGVTVHPWPPSPAGAPLSGHDGQPCAPGAVVIEAFGCDLPAWYAAAMAAMPRPPVWIDLEYLSAEGYVERSHRLPSPQMAGPGAGLVRHFFYPGFTPATGGLIREPDLADERDAFDAAAWLRRFGLERRAGERIVSLFCYSQPAFDSLIDHLAEAPTLILLTPGQASRQAERWLAQPSRRPRIRWLTLPWLPQADYDRLLWACDLNFVRGEDSFVRAQWAGAPFVWQAYPQAEGRHLVKVEAFLQRHLAGVDSDLADSIRRLWSAWNGGPDSSPGDGTAKAASAALALPAMDRWRQACIDWRARLLAQPDLVSGLIRFAAEIAARNG